MALTALTGFIFEIHKTYAIIGALTLIPLNYYIFGRKTEHQNAEQIYEGGKWKKVPIVVITILYTVLSIVLFFSLPALLILIKGL